MFVESRSFKPAQNKDGYVRLTYIGYGRITGSDSPDFGLTEKQNQALEIKFLMQCMNSSDEFISLYITLDDFSGIAGVPLSDFTHGENSGIILKNLGFEKITIVEDEEGFSMLDTSGIGDSYFLRLAYISSFLESIQGNVYIAKLSNLNHGKRDTPVWSIDVNTIKLFKVAEKSIDGLGN